MKEYKNIELKKVFADITPIENESGVLQGLNFKFKPKNENQTIYETSDGNIVRNFPEELIEEGISLDMNALNKLNSGMANVLSTYLFSHRKELNGGDMSMNIHSKIDEKMKLRMFISKHFFRQEGKNKGREKIKLSFILDDEDFGTYEILTIPFTKTDVQFLFNIVRDIVTSYNRFQTVYLPVERVSYENEDFLYEANVGIAKIDNSLLIGEVWLHGQELLNLLYLVDKLIYSMNIEDNLDVLNTFYRQLSITNENGIVYLTLNRKQGDHTDNPMVDLDETEYKLKIPMSAAFISVLHMALSITVLRHADIEFEYDRSIEVLGTQDPFANVKAMKYHISMKESSIGIAVDKNSKGENRIRLVGSVKQGNEKFFNEKTGEFEDNVFEKNGEIHNILNSFNINLRDQWPKLIKALAIAYNKEYITPSKDFNLIKFFVLDNAPGEKMHKYEFSILSNKDNKASAVLTIKKFDRENLVASYRQPLFDKYLYQLIIMLLAAGDFIKDIKFTQEMNKLDLIRYRYKSMKSVSRLTKNEIVEYGLQKDGEHTYWGIFSDSNKMFDILPDQDRYMLNISAQTRIIRGKWLPFVGETIAVGPDRFITDMHGELETDEDPKDFEGVENKPMKGLDWATMIYFGTAEIE